MYVSIARSDSILSTYIVNSEPQHKPECLFQNFSLRVSKNCTDEFEKMKMQNAYRYIIFKLSDDMKEIQVEECGSRGMYSCRKVNTTFYYLKFYMFKYLVCQNQCHLLLTFQFHIHILDATYEDMRAKLLGKVECRYAACDLEFDDASGKPKSKIVFIPW